MATAPFRRNGQARLLAARSRVNQGWLGASGNLHACAQVGPSVVTRAEDEMVKALAWAFDTYPECVTAALDSAAHLYGSCRFCALRWLFVSPEPTGPVWFSAAFSRSYAEENPDHPPAFAAMVEHLVWGCLASRGVRSKEDALRLIRVSHPRRVFEA